MPRTPGTEVNEALWIEPYLETCCRSAMHRLAQVEAIGRPPRLKDGPCLERLAGQGLARLRPDGRFEITPQGRARHASEIIGRPVRPRTR